MFKLISYVFTPLGFIATIMPFIRDFELVKHVTEAIKDIGISPSVPSFLIAALCGTFAIKKDLQTEIVEKYDSPRVTIEIIEGDLFSQHSFDIVIGACDTFDTQTPDIIAKNSIQGQAIDKLFDGDIDSLNQKLKRKLKYKNRVGKIKNEFGKRYKYEIGTTVALRSKSKNASQQSYWVAFTNMGKNNVVTTSPDYLWISLKSLWNTIAEQGNGTAVAMPVVGSGISGLDRLMTSQSLLEFILYSFWFHSKQQKITPKLRIVVRSEDRDDYDWISLREFVSSLK